MEIRQLQHFLAVARTGSLSAAAGELGMAQSGISSSLAALERELAVSLVLRSPGRRGIELTGAGQALLSPAQDVVASLAAARAAVASSGEVQGPVRVATVTTPPELAILQTQLDFQMRHPDVKVSITSGSSDEVLSLVGSGDVDFGIAAVGPHDRPQDRLGLDAALLTCSPLALLCSPEHRLAALQDVAAEDLVGERVLGLPAVHRPRRLLDAWLARGGVMPARLGIIDSEDYAAVLDLVRQGRGVTYGPAAFASVIRSAGLVQVPLRQAPVWELSLITTLGGPKSCAAAALRDAHLQRCAPLTTIKDSAGQGSTPSTP